MTKQSTDNLPRLILHDDDSFARLLIEGQRLIMEYPRAARAVAQALAAEGRRFAEMPEGNRWKERLSLSVLIRKGQLLWQAYGLDLPAEGDSVTAPSDWMDSLVAGLAGANIESILSDIMLESLSPGLAYIRPF